MTDPVNTPRLNRRQALTRTGLLAGAVLGAQRGNSQHAAAESGNPANRFSFCLNTGTLRGQKLGIVREVETAAQAGYTGIEPWVSDVQEYQKNGGSMTDLRSRIADGGLRVESAIAFPQWISDDQTKREQALEQAKREMDLIAQLGGQRIAAPPAGATGEPVLDLEVVADRYRALLQVGEQIGVIPQLELWGFSRNLHRLGQVANVIVESGHPKAAAMPDTFHIYKGGSSFAGLRLFGPTAIQVYHLNDYPADPPQAEVKDEHRIFPGDGVAPTAAILQSLAFGGGKKVLSLELFNRDYWKQDPLKVARDGLAKMKSSVARAFTD